MAPRLEKVVIAEFMDQKQNWICTKMEKIL